MAAVAMKALGNRVALMMGPFACKLLPRDRFLSFCRVFLDPRVVPRQLLPRPLRSTGATILCNPYIYAHRAPFWLGQLYERALEAYLVRELKPGDTVIDVGMNVGHVTVLAASLVGRSGRVYGYEPNKTLAALTAAHCQAQGLEQVSVVPVGLGDNMGESLLQYSDACTGTGTLRGLQLEARQVLQQQMSVRIERGDDSLLPRAMPGRVFLKLDVEGYELDVLRGMPRLLHDRVNHAVIEVTPEWIGGPNGVAELFEVMNGYGFCAWSLTDRGDRGPALVPEQIQSQTNVIFVRENPANTRS